jgi:hypothetical protein
VIEVMSASQLHSFEDVAGQIRLMLWKADEGTLVVPIEIAASGSKLQRFTQSFGTHILQIAPTRN